MAMMRCKCWGERLVPETRDERRTEGPGLFNLDLSWKVKRVGRGSVNPDQMLKRYRFPLGTKTLVPEDGVPGSRKV
jgi:hypothetical protein